MAFDGRLLGGIGVSAVLETVNFVRAAEALGLTPSVSRAVVRLEARIGVRLLDRTPRAVALTDEGRWLDPEVIPLSTGTEDAATVTSGSSVAVRGRLRVNVDVLLLTLPSTPLLAELSIAPSPTCRSSWAARDQLGDLIGEGFDIAVDSRMPRWHRLWWRGSPRDAHGHGCVAGLSEAHGPPLAPSDLRQSRCIQVRDRPRVGRSRRGSSAEDEVIEVRTTGRRMVAKFGTMLGACPGRVGIARVKASACRHLIEQGASLELLPD